MAKRMRSWNKRKYEQYLHAGRGQGEGSAYMPWISVQDFSSQGMVSRIYSYKTERIHHFLSHNELSYFYLLEWSERVLDIREQYPLLDMELATDAAQRAGIRYPRDNISGFPYILTCDFMITTGNGFRARTIKSASELRNKRTLEKLEIERRYWKTLDIDWQIVTEHGIDFQKAKYIEWLYTAAKLPEHLVNQIYRDAILNRIETTSIPQTANWFDKQYGFPPGNGLTLIKNLIWNRQIVYETGRDFEYSQPEMRICV